MFTRVISSYADELLRSNLVFFNLSDTHDETRINGYIWADLAESSRNKILKLKYFFFFFF